jgi:hypothetical protein
VKVDLKHPKCLLQPLQIPEWKWDTISMDFITSLPSQNKSNIYKYGIHIQESNDAR